SGRALFKAGVDAIRADRGKQLFPALGDARSELGRAGGRALSEGADAPARSGRLAAFPPATGAAGSTGLRALPLAIRFALREMRGGLSGFFVFLACIALGVASIGGVNSVARAIAAGVAGQGQVLLGGD